MNIQEYQNKKQELGVEGTGVDATTTEERAWTNKKTKQITFTIPRGVKVHVDFMPKSNPGRVHITYGNEVKISRTAGLYKWLTGFRKPPTMKTLEKRSWDGISKSVIGEKVELDGYGPSGAPSWELTLSLI